VGPFSCLATPSPVTHVFLTVAVEGESNRCSSLCGLPLHGKLMRLANLGRRHHRGHVRDTA
jgi:hypothetical protein